MKIEGNSIYNAAHVFNRPNDTRAQRRMHEQRNEAKIREGEDKLIQELQKRITDIRGTEMDKDLKDYKIESLSNQIQEIYKARAQREQEAAKREIEEMQAEQEKKQEEQEKKNAVKENPNETKEDVLRRADIKSLSKISMSHDTLSTLKRTKAAQSAEAEQLQQDIENTTGFAQIGLDTTIKVKSGYDKPGDFRNRHLARLNQGIAQLDTTIAAQQRSIHKTAAEWMKKKIEIVQDAPVKEDKDETATNESDIAAAETVDNTKANETAQKAAPSESTVDISL